MDFPARVRGILQLAQDCKKQLLHYHNGIYMHVAKLLQFIGHTGTIAGIAFSPDGSRVVTGAHRSQELDRDAIVWDVPSGKVLMRLHGHQTEVFSVAYAPNGKLIATGGGGAMMGDRWTYDGVVRLWDEDGRERGTIGHQLFVVNALAVSPDNRYLLSGGNNPTPHSPADLGSPIRLWDLSCSCEIRRFGTHSSNVLSVAFSPDGEYAVAGCTGFGFGASVSAPAASRNGTTLIARVFGALTQHAQDSKDTPDQVDMCYRTLRMWRVDNGAEVDRFPHWEWVNAVSFSPDGTQLVSAGWSVVLWDAKSGKEIRKIGGAEARFSHCASFSPDGRHIAIGVGGRSDPGSPYENCFVLYCDASTGAEMARWDHKYPVTALAFCPKGEFILAGGERGEMHMWKVVS